MPKSPLAHPLVEAVARLIDEAAPAPQVLARLKDLHEAHVADEVLDIDPVPGPIGMAMGKLLKNRAGSYTSQERLDIGHAVMEISRIKPTVHLLNYIARQLRTLAETAESPAVEPTVPEKQRHEPDCDKRASQRNKILSSRNEDELWRWYRYFRKDDELRNAALDRLEVVAPRSAAVHVALAKRHRMRRNLAAAEAAAASSVEINSSMVFNAAAYTQKVVNLRHRNNLSGARALGQEVDKALRQELELNELAPWEKTKVETDRGYLLNARGKVEQVDGQYLAASKLFMEAAGMPEGHRDAIENLEALIRVCRREGALTLGEALEEELARLKRHAVRPG